MTAPQNYSDLYYQTKGTNSLLCTIRHKQSCLYYHAQTVCSVLSGTSSLVCTITHKQSDLYYQAQTVLCTIRHKQSSLYYQAQAVSSVLSDNRQSDL